MFFKILIKKCYTISFWYRYEWSYNFAQALNKMLTKFAKFKKNLNISLSV